jgi:hypothetical protein
MSSRSRATVKWVLILVAVALVASAAAFSWLRFAPRRVPQGQAALATVTSRSLPQLREAFNAGESDVRVLALLSPT